MPTRGTVMVLLAVTNQGKSWWLTHLGRHALMHHKRVMHMSLELATGDAQKRYYQCFLAAALREDELNGRRTVLLRDGDDRLVGFEREAVTAEFSLQNPDHRQLKQVKAQWGKKMKIKQFPMRGLSVQGLRGYLDGEEALGFMRTCCWSIRPCCCRPTARTIASRSAGCWRSCAGWRWSATLRW